MLVLNLPFKGLMFLTLMRPSLGLFLVLWLKLVKDVLKVRCRLALLPFRISCLSWLDVVASLPLIKERILVISLLLHFFFFSSRRRHTRFDCDWSSDVCSSDLRWTPESPALRSAPASRSSRTCTTSPRGRRPRCRCKSSAASAPRSCTAARRQIGRASCRERV